MFDARTTTGRRGRFLIMAGLFAGLVAMLIAGFGAPAAAQYVFEGPKIEAPDPSTAFEVKPGTKRVYVQLVEWYCGGEGGKSPKQLAEDLIAKTGKSAEDAREIVDLDGDYDLRLGFYDQTRTGDWLRAVDIKGPGTYTVAPFCYTRDEYIQLHDAVEAALIANLKRFGQ